ncbi:MAG: hypothetical protein V1734_02940 [Nanoarchaeota archaeon]
MLDLEKRLYEAKKDTGDAATELIAGSFVAPITAFAGTYNFVNSDYLLGYVFAAATAFLFYVAGSRYSEIRQCRKEIAELEKEISEDKA